MWYPLAFFYFSLSDWLIYDFIIFHLKFLLTNVNNSLNSIFQFNMSPKIKKMVD